MKNKVPHEYADIVEEAVYAVSEFERLVDVSDRLTDDLETAAEDAQELYEKVEEIDHVVTENSNITNGKSYREMVKLVEEELGVQPDNSEFFLLRNIREALEEVYQESHTRYSEIQSRDERSDDQTGFEDF